MLMTSSHLPAGYPSTHGASFPFKYLNSHGRYLHRYVHVPVPGHVPVSGHDPVSGYVPATTTTTTTTTTTANNNNNDNNNKKGDYQSADHHHMTYSDDPDENTSTDDYSLWNSLKSNYPYLFVFVLFSFIGYPVYNRNSNNNNNSNNINSNNRNSNNNWDRRRREELELSDIRFPAENQNSIRDQGEYGPSGENGGYGSRFLLTNTVNDIYNNGISFDESNYFVVDT